MSTAAQSRELAHSITSSAMASSPGGKFQAGNETNLDRVCSAGEDDWNGRGRRLCRQRRRPVGGHQHSHPAANEIGRQSRELIVLAVREAEFDREIPASNC
jgi:hypothetical protein